MSVNEMYDLIKTSHNKYHNYLFNQLNNIIGRSNIINGINNRDYFMKLCICEINKCHIHDNNIPHVDTGIIMNINNNPTKLCVIVYPA